MTIQKKTLWSLFIFLLIGHILADTCQIFVDPSEGTAQCSYKSPCNTIENALSASYDLSSCDEIKILLHSGNYRGIGNVGINFHIPPNTQKFTIAAADGASVEIDGEFHEPIFIFTNITKSLSISGITFMNGRNTENGGCLHISGTAKSSIVIGNSTFLQCTSQVNGGGVDLKSAGAVSVSGSLFFNNTANHGGGLHIETLESSEASLVDNLFEGNTARLSGGGLLITGTSTDAHVFVVSSTIKSNFGRDGAGLLTSVKGLYTDLTFHNNVAHSIGGAISIVFSTGPVQLTSSSVTDSIAEDGAGIYIYNSIVELTKTKIHNNLARNNGSGIYLQSKQSNGGPCATHFSDVILSENRALGFGGGLFCQTGCAENQDTTFLNNVADSDFENTLSPDVVCSSECSSSLCPKKNKLPESVPVAQNVPVSPRNVETLFGVPLRANDFESMTPEERKGKMLPMILVGVLMPIAIIGIISIYVIFRTHHSSTNNLGFSH
eukprot:TRINITY_DN1374_c0_g1_i1.p1 TRINITY_DN1374_c0_g1~~TRINITY_DN1374_c0_g1_i1.p1  ORF type:complete len:493 (+),score=82.24 TRINITY_DN1374_c0_g1_i1:82-1560(+)